MGLDLRLPLGLLFTILGALLTVAGARCDTASNAPSLGVNIDLQWGICMILFGVLVLLLAWRGGKKPSGH